MIKKEPGTAVQPPPMPIRDYREEAGLPPVPPPCNHQWIASKFEITGANSAFATEWKVTHVKCVNCREEREL